MHQREMTAPRVELVAAQFLVQELGDVSKPLQNGTTQDPELSSLIAVSPLRPSPRASKRAWGGGSRRLPTNQGNARITPLPIYRKKAPQAHISHTWHLATLRGQSAAASYCPPPLHAPASSTPTPNTYTSLPDPTTYKGDRFTPAPPIHKTPTITHIHIISPPP